jgi:hypothetical protein
MGIRFGAFDIEALRTAQSADSAFKTLGVNYQYSWGAFPVGSPSSFHGIVTAATDLNQGFMVMDLGEILKNRTYLPVPNDTTSYGWPGGWTNGYIPRISHGVYANLMLTASIHTCDTQTWIGLGTVTKQPPSVPPTIVLWDPTSPTSGDADGSWTNPEGIPNI